MKTMSVKEAYQSDAPLIDVRAAKDFAKKHIEGAVNIPLRNTWQLNKTVTKDTLIICYKGVTSRNICALLRKGISVRGGMQAWTEAGLPVK